MAMGLPVVTSRIGRIVDPIQQEETGLLVSVDDVGALTVALERLVGDASLRPALSVRSRASEAFSPAGAAAKLTGLCLAHQTHQPRESFT